MNLAHFWPSIICLHIAFVTGCDDGDGNGAPPPPCPEDPPEDGESCEHENLDCFWQRCDGADPNVFRATCRQGSWSRFDQGCETQCDSMTCASDEICHEMSGGASMVECAVNPCGEAPIEAACACDALCTGYECSVYGLTVTCNTCTGAEMCP